jgi:hypothetical protein
MMESPTVASDETATSSDETAAAQLHNTVDDKWNLENMNEDADQPIDRAAPERPPRQTQVDRSTTSDA